MAENEDIDHVDFVSAYAQRKLNDPIETVLLCTDDGQVFGSWSADEDREGITLNLIAHLQEPIKYLELCATIAFSGESEVGKLRRDTAMLYLTSDSIQAMKLKQLTTLTQRVRVTPSFSLL